MSNTNRNVTGHQLELERLNRKLAEVKGKYAKKKEFNDRLEASLRTCGLTIRTTNELGARATTLNNELVEAYEMAKNSLKEAIEEAKKDKVDADKEKIEAEKHTESKMLDEEIAKAEDEKKRLTTKLEQLNIDEAKSKKEEEDLRDYIKKMGAYIRSGSSAKKDKKSEKTISVATSELDSSQGNLTQSDERLLDIQGIEQESFLDRYFGDIAKIKQENVSE